MKVLAIDPGFTHSAYLIYDTEGHAPAAFGKADNLGVLCMIRTGLLEADQCVIEMVACYGMAVGKEVFETVYWLGRFGEAWDQWADANRQQRHSRLVRKDVKMFLCGNNKAKDSNIRQALIDLFGPGKEVAIGKKASPGPLYGVSADVWAALALAVTFSAEMRKAG